MHKIININGTRQLANISGVTPVAEAKHEDINEMLRMGIVSEDAVEQWAVLSTDLDVEVALPNNGIPTFTNREEKEYLMS